MQTLGETVIGIVVVVFFIWRFARTRQLYRYSLKVLKGQVTPTEFKPSLSREFFNKALLGNRNAEPKQFILRALVFVVIAVILLPFKDYAPTLYWMTVFLIILYGPWCIIHGISLRQKREHIRLQSTR
jgi:hypothetical protein